MTSKTNQELDMGLEVLIFRMVLNKGFSRAF